MSDSCTKLLFSLFTNVWELRYCAPTGVRHCAPTEGDLLWGASQRWKGKTSWETHKCYGSVKVMLALLDIYPLRQAFILLMVVLTSHTSSLPTSVNLQGYVEITYWEPKKGCSLTLKASIFGFNIESTVNLGTHTHPLLLITWEPFVLGDVWM